MDGAVDLSKMRRDLSRRQSFRMSSDSTISSTSVKLGCLPLLHDLRLESSFPVAGNINADLTCGIGDDRLRAGAIAHIPRLTDRPGLVLLISQMLGDLLVQGCFQHILGEQLQQPIRAGQRQAPLTGLGHHRRRVACSGDSCRPSLLSLLSGFTASDVIGHSGSIPPDLSPACRAGNTVRCTVPWRQKSVNLFRGGFGVVRSAS